MFASDEPKVAHDERKEGKRKIAGAAATRERRRISELGWSREAPATAVSYFQAGSSILFLPSAGRLRRASFADATTSLQKQQAAATATALAGVCYTRAETTDGTETGCRSGFAAGDR